jgi:hypothetical protein
MNNSVHDNILRKWAWSSKNWIVCKPPRTNDMACHQWRGGLISKNGIAAIYRGIVTVRLFIMTNVVFVGSVAMMVYITGLMAV